ncbi:pancreatic secretory granule membrane major glycoprotein GP2-like [Mixophyes fleayi]|uniref:pancreatic secretory granule membrane major glycoprotein GP2-like n=1 Tax=Mixophyes fleayi TaxID=3061075 RepID=UPI003F4E1990
MKFVIFITLCTLLKHTVAQGAGCYDGSDPALCSDCGGSCDPENGCLCSDSISQCFPVASKCPMESNDCCNVTSGWYWNSICCTDVKQCSPSCQSDESCDIVNGPPTCVCNKTIYSGITPARLKPTVTCNDGTMETYVNICELKALGYQYSAFHLINNSVYCNFQYNTTINNVSVSGIQLQTAKGWCGNIVTQDSSNIYITNTLYIAPTAGPLITKNPLSYNITCAYNLTMQTSLNFSLHPVLSTITLTPENGTGVFTVTMAAYKDLSHTQPIQQDEQVVIGSDVYLGLLSPDADGDVFALRVESCLATPTNNRSDTNSVQLVSGGSATDNGVLTTVERNGVSLEAIIKISSFAFQGYTEVYIFCDVELCKKSNGCSGSRSSRSADSVFSGLGINLLLQDDMNYTSFGHNTAASWAVLAASLLAFLTIKFF